MTRGSDLEHAWDLAPSDAIALQKALAARVICETTFDTVRVVGGVDASYKAGQARAVVVLMNYPELEILEYQITERPISYPYVPGLLSFREAPAVLDLCEQVKHRPDLLIFDGHGIAHPRRIGLASHIGIRLDLPSIGCAKRRLVGTYEPPGEERGSISYLRAEGPDDDEVIGAVVRTRTRVKPVFVSIGHRIDLETAVRYVLSCGRGYKLPEPTRWADRIAGGAYPQ